MGSGTQASGGFWAERIDPLRFLAGCRKRHNQALSVLSLSFNFIWVCFVLFTRVTYCAALFCFVCVLFQLGCQYQCASDWLERLISEMTCNLLMGTLNPTHSLTHSLTHSRCSEILYRPAALLDDEPTMPLSNSQYYNVSQESSNFGKF